MFVFFFFKQKTAYEMRISDWSSDVCSSDLPWPCGRSESWLFHQPAGECADRRAVVARTLEPRAVGGSGADGDRRAVADGTAWRPAVDRADPGFLLRLLRSAAHTGGGGIGAGTGHRKPVAHRAGIGLFDRQVQGLGMWGLVRFDL